MLRTFQTKIKNCDTKYLDELASFFGYIERKLFLEHFIQNKSRNECKKTYILSYKITARQFNSIYFVLLGKIKSVQASQKVRKIELEAKTKSLTYEILRLTEQKNKMHHKLMNQQKIKPKDERTFKLMKKYQKLKLKIHQKKRKQERLIYKLNQLIKNEQEKRIRLCFGSIKLFRKQFNLSLNNYKNHGEWKRDWIESKSTHIYCIGSKDETCGNQSCTYLNNNEVRLRVANQFINEYGKYLIFKNIRFPYGQEIIDKAREIYLGTTKSHRVVKYCKAPISYRFVKRKKGWYLYATTHEEEPNLITSKNRGCIGIDLNAGFVSCCEIDRYGNPVDLKKLRMNIYNRSKKQVEATIGDTVRDIVNYSLKTSKPIAIEKLDFQEKKTNLKENGKKYSRMLSGFAYSKFKEILLSRANRFGVEVIEVNAAYTSIIGQVKFMKRYGLSSHGSAACVIARRGCNFKLEQPNYKNNLYDFSYLKTSRKQSWITISNYMKNHYKFNERIELLKIS